MRLPSRTAPRHAGQFTGTRGRFSGRAIWASLLAKLVARLLLASGEVHPSPSDPVWYPAAPPRAGGRPRHARRRIAHWRRDEDPRAAARIGIGRQRAAPGLVAASIAARRRTAQRKRRLPTSGSVSAFSFASEPLLGQVITRIVSAPVGTA